MKVQLFYPKSQLNTYVNNGVYFSLTLLNIASYVKFYRPDIDIEIWDGELYSNEELIKKLDKNSDVVGISCTSFNYPHALILAQHAKDLGLYVVLGGNHPTYYKKKILENRSFIDGVFVGKGEYAFLKLLNEKDKANVPNFIWRDGDKIRENSENKSISINEMPYLDYSLLELNKYSTNHQKVYPNLPGNPLSVLTHEGCAKREKYGPCSFCAMRTKLAFKDPTIFWQETEKAVQKYGFNIVRDWGDSLTEDKDFFSRLVNSRPESLKDLSFSVYSTIASMDADKIELLKKLNVKMLFAAIESGSDKILNTMNKQATSEQMFRAMELIGKTGISVMASYVLGERGEDIESLESTLNIAEKTQKIANITVANGSPINITPGSSDFELLAQKFPELKNQDLLDMDELRDLWVKNFCPKLPNADILKEYAEKIGKLGNLKTNYGWEKAEKLNKE